MVLDQGPPPHHVTGTGGMSVERPTTTGGLRGAVSVSRHCRVQEIDNHLPEREPRRVFSTMVKISVTKMYFPTGHTLQLRNVGFGMTIVTGGK
jgi:hypothetical protein